MPNHGKVINMAERRPENREQLLERLFRENEASLRAFLGVRLGAAEDREDIIQDVFYRLARQDNLVEVVYSQNNPKAYLYAIANNLVVDYYRKKSVRAPHESGQATEFPEATVTITPETILAASEELERAKAIIMSLRPRPRRAFILNRFQHMSYREVADEMGVSLKRAEKYIAKALTALRDGTVCDGAVRDGRERDSTQRSNKS